MLPRHRQSMVECALLVAGVGGSMMGHKTAGLIGAQTNGNVGGGGIGTGGGGRGF